MCDKPSSLCEQYARCDETPTEPTKGDFLRCRCGCFQMNHRSATEGGCRNCPCVTFELGDLAPEPPLTPEEEEQAPEDAPLCEIPHATIEEEDACERERLAAKAPPQPDRRPPVVVAYSVQGHLYEVALSGDATASAVDGALVIQHALGPVAGIVRVAPLNTEES